MSITGIDQETCSKCKICMRVCGRGYFQEDSSGDIIFKDPTKMCNLCGHCIAACPEDAIKRNLDWQDDVETLSEQIVSYEKILQLLRMIRSVRHYKKKNVPNNLIDKVFKAMRYAPSAGNARLWKYKVLTNSVTINELGHAIAKTMYQYWGFNSYDQAKKYFESMGRQPVFYQAPAVIILYYEGKVPNKTMFGIWGNDAGIAITYGQLAAESLGLGTCWIGALQGAIPLNKEEILKIIGIGGIVLGAMTIGYPAIKYYRTTPRAPLDVKELK